MAGGTCARFDDDLMERYSFGRLTGQECAAFEEHLLTCEACQDRLRANDEFVAAMKAACVASLRHPPTKAAMAATFVVAGFSLMLALHLGSAVRETTLVCLKTAQAGDEAKAFGPGTDIALGPVLSRGRYWVKLS